MSDAQNDSCFAAAATATSFAYYQFYFDDILQCTYTHKVTPHPIMATHTCTNICVIYSDTQLLYEYNTLTEKNIFVKFEISYCKMSSFNPLSITTVDQISICCNFKCQTKLLWGTLQISMLYNLHEFNELL